MSMYISINVYVWICVKCIFILFYVHIYAVDSHYWQILYCEFASLKSVIFLQNQYLLSQSSMDMCRVAKNWSHQQTCAFPAETQERVLVSALIMQTWKGPFHGLFSTMFFAFLCFLLISLFKMMLKCCLV